MSALLLEPFGYSYMVNAMWVSALVGGVCAFLSVYLMLKGWSLIGDALSHSIVPGVAGAYMLGLPFALGAFLSGGLAAGAIATPRQALANPTDSSSRISAAASAGRPTASRSTSESGALAMPVATEP